MEDFGGWKREKYNPIEWMARIWPQADTDHIKFNPELDSQYYRGIEGGGDGTLLFFYQDLSRVLLPFMNMSTFYLPDQPDGNLSGYKRIEYELGWLKVAAVYGMIKLKCSETQLYRGEKYRIRVRARATLIPLST